MANNYTTLGFKEDSIFGKFYKQTSNQKPEERAVVLETFQDFAVAHQDSAQEGQTRPPSEDEDVKLIKFLTNCSF